MKKYESIRLVWLKSLTLTLSSIHMYDDDYDESNEWNEWINVWMRWLVASSVSSSFNKIIRENDNFVVRSTMFFFLLSSIFHFLTEFLSEFLKKKEK